MSISNSDISNIGIFLGGMRCGSTAMHDYMKQHPDVCIYKKHDPHYFSGDEQWQAGWNDYLAGWNNYNLKKHKIAFESSTHYTKFPTFKHTAERMASSPFNLKLIYGVRPPIERIESHFIHNAGKRYFDPTNQKDRQKLLKYAINVSNYELQISNYEKYFSAQQIKIMDTRDLLDKPIITLREICEFLAIDADYNFKIIPRRPRKFKYDISDVRLTTEEKQQASELLYHPIKCFQERFNIVLWDGLNK